MEPACGAAVAAVYSGVIQKLQKENRLPSILKSVVVIVCGGASVTLSELMRWKKELGMSD